LPSEQPAEIEHHLPLVLVENSGARRPVPGVLGYRRCDPFAVRLSFPGTYATGQAAEAGELSWLLARELLESGLYAPVGEGDVRLLPGPYGVVYIRLSCGSEGAVLEARVDSVERFLTACRDCVPPGTEPAACDWDAEWDALTGQDRP
jgi:hypothetical protein